MTKELIVLGAGCFVVGVGVFVATGNMRYALGAFLVAWGLSYTKVGK